MNETATLTLRQFARILRDLRGAFVEAENVAEPVPTLAVECERNLRAAMRDMAIGSVDVDAAIVTSRRDVPLVDFDVGNVNVAAAADGTAQSGATVEDEP